MAGPTGYDDGAAPGRPDPDRKRSLQERLRLAFLTPRGWGLFLAGAATLVLAWLMGRRELVNIAVFLAVVPLLSAAVVRIGGSRLHVRRGFDPDPVIAGETAHVRLEVSHRGQLPGSVSLTEALPPRFGASPRFDYPRSGGRYRYRLKPARRGVYSIGPLTALFTDPFGLASRPGAVDRPAPLTVVQPVPRLEPNGVLGDAGSHGEARANRQATPDSDDVMTREYRDGDPMRRVHWPATARHGSLMVRQEEYRSTPRATLLVDRRREPYNGSYLGFDEPLEVANFTGSPGTTTPCFDWVLSAALGIAAHLAELGYAVDLLDQDGRPLAGHSTSAPDGHRDLFSGPDAATDLQLALAGVGLEDPAAPRRRSGHDPDGLRQASPPGGPGDNGVVRRLSAVIRNARNPLVLLTGRLTEAEATEWVEAVGSGRNTAVFLATSTPSASLGAASVFRQAGWHPIGATPDQPVAAAWTRLGTVERIDGTRRSR
ncbi:DUF58 domain-containing protein [Zafaria sp. Z1313]|uniref:DUF58 domain-containing protein n=1 Tax=Zafaria sp. Z1313 TaxID=3423202 RepID=UPI003D303190